MCRVVEHVIRRYIKTNTSAASRDESCLSTTVDTAYRKLSYAIMKNNDGKMIMVVRVMKTLTFYFII